MPVPDLDELQPIRCKLIGCVPRCSRSRRRKGDTYTALRHTGKASSVSDSTQRVVAAASHLHGVARQKSQRQIIISTELLSGNNRGLKFNPELDVLIGRPFELSSIFTILVIAATSTASIRTPPLRHPLQWRQAPRRESLPCHGSFSPRLPAHSPC